MGNSQYQMNLKTTYRVGSADDADVVIKQITVSKRHCELSWTGEDWELRDLDSTNGTFVDGVRITEVCKVNSNNKITLGRGVAVSLPPTPSSQTPISQTKPSPAFASIDSSPLPVRKGKPISTNLLVATICFVALSAFLGGFVFFRGGAGQSYGTGSDSETASKSDKLSELPKVVEAEQSQKTSPQTNPLASPPKDSPFWAIIVESVDGKNRQLVGTAVAIESNRLLTLASIVEAIQELKPDYPILLLQQFQQPGVSIRPLQFVAHPGYKNALSQLVDFEAKLKEKLKSIDNLAQPSLEESLDWSGRLETVMSEIAKCDLACLITAESLKKLLPIASDSKTSGPQDCKVVGYPMIVPSPNLNSNLESFYLEGNGKVQLDEKIKTPVLFVETSNFPGVPIISMVCQDQLSQLIGLCVRQEPVQSVGAPQRSQIISVEVFWK